LRNIWLKYTYQLALLLIMNSLIKGFDSSFNGVFDFSLRSVLFFLGSVVYWMIMWSVSSYLITKIGKRVGNHFKPIVLFGFLSITVLGISIATAIFFNLLYRESDIRFFGMDTLWASVPFPHPELIYPLILISLSIFIIDRFIVFTTQLKDAEIYAAHLEQDSIQAKYDALKSQIDPHFFFNSLSVLTSTIQTNPELSIEYIHNLSKLYRSLLETKTANIVPVSDELGFLNSYIFLIKIRYPDCLNFQIVLNPKNIDKSGILPNSLQLLVENAIKHNTFKDDDPLDIEIFEEGEFICTRNLIRKKKLLGPSTGIGLENIRRRYELQGYKISIREDNGYFTVKLPKIEIHQR